MSMISSKCDELRDWACELRKLANGPVNEGFPAREKLFESADAMCQAADTILELRDDLRQANESTEDAEHDESMAWDRVRKAEAENVKLRGLVRDMWFSDYAGRFSTLPEHQEHQVTVWQRMRELRIEVDE